MIRPLSDRVVIRQIDGAPRIGSIVVPQEARQKPLQGRVVAVGPGLRHRKTGVLRGPTVQPGDVVIWDTRTGFDVEYNGETYAMMRETDLLAIVSASA